MGVEHGRDSELLLTDTELLLDRNPNEPILEPVRPLHKILWPHQEGHYTLTQRRSR